MFKISIAISIFLFLIFAYLRFSDYLPEHAQQEEYTQYQDEEDTGGVDWREEGDPPIEADRPPHPSNNQ